jgi:galactose mutarotase-like enzyme
VLDSSFSGDGIVGLTFAPGAGGALTALDARIGGRSVSLFPERDLAALDARISKDPNVAFQQICSPLFPLANRLRDPVREASPNGIGTAELAGCELRFPLNHRASASHPPHHLHGLLYDRAATDVAIRKNTDEVGASAIFRDFFRGFWTGNAEVTVSHLLVGGKYRFEMHARNVGDVDMPVGFGSHPYFRIPSGARESARIVIPASRAGAIDGVENVFPLGRWIEVGGSRLDFRKGGLLDSDTTDHFFLFEENGPKHVELLDSHTGIGYRMRATTGNVKGAQMYYPGRGDVVALELVTHVPDPRPEVWGRMDTGIRILKPGESETYGFEIELFRS